MVIWEADFYKGPQVDENGKVIWELLICDRHTQEIIYEAQCPQNQANSEWLVAQIKQAAAGVLPEQLWIFRPQSVSLLQVAAQKLGFVVKATPRTPAIKQALQQRSRSIELELPPPLPLPEELWGVEWRLGSIQAGDLVDLFSELPIPIKVMPEYLNPLNMGIASSLPVPGVVIYGGKQSLNLARFLEMSDPVSLKYLPTEVGKSGGFVLSSGLIDRWIIATFEDPQAAQAADVYEKNKLACQGLHFLIIQPDDSGMTHSAIWLLQEDC